MGKLANYVVNLKRNQGIKLGQLRTKETKKTNKNDPESGNQDKSQRGNIRKQYTCIGKAARKQHI